MSEQRFIQVDAVKELKRSRLSVGELLPVVIDRRTNKVISGNHRLKAGWHKREYVTTKDDVEAAKLTLHYNVGRKGMPPEEIVTMLVALGDALLTAGKKPGSQVMQQIFEMSPWEDSYTYEMIPRRFKNQGDGPGRPAGPQNIPASGILPSNLPKGIGYSDGEPHVNLVTCSRCGLKGVSVAGILREQ